MKNQLRNHLQDIEIPADNPFNNCVLGREYFANIITDVINLYSDTGCVIALNGEWGVGKTTFVKMWQQKLTNKGYRTIYYNSWESDFVDNPMIALLSEIEGISINDNKQLKANAGRIITTFGKAFGKHLLKKYTGIDNEVINDTVDGFSKLCEDSIKEYQKQKAAIDDFKKSLIEFVANKDNEKPIVFFIDELDRCNPLFAVKTLEQIKHLFEIPNIVFILSINKKQLECAIQGYYGSSKMDANEYLRRFIDVECSLPNPDMEKFIDYLLQQYNFSTFFRNSDRNRNQALRDNEEYFIQIIKYLISFNNCNLRLTDKIFSYLRLVLYTFDPMENIIPDLLTLLVFWKITDFDLYDNIKHHNYSIKELIKTFESKLPKPLLEKTSANNEYIIRTMMFVLVHFLICYNTNDNLYEIENIKEHKDEIISYCAVLNKELFSEAFDHYTNQGGSYAISMNKVIRHIDIISSIKI